MNKLLMQRIERLRDGIDDAPLNELAWDIKGGYWYTKVGDEITSEEMREYATQLEAEIRELHELCWKCTPI